MSKGLTKEQIVRHLGLEDPEAYRKQRIRKNAEYMPRELGMGRRRRETMLAIRTRGTGRSWRMIIAALVEASKGSKVWIAAHSPAAGDMFVAQAHEWARKLGIPTDRIVAATRDGWLPDQWGYLYSDPDSRRVAPA